MRTLSPKEEGGKRAINVLYRTIEYLVLHFVWNKGINAIRLRSGIIYSY
jgi:hypothetical protein